MSDVKTDPTKFLSSIIGSAVTVKLHNGVEYQGDLQSIDGYMNVVLQSAKEFVETTEIKSYGDVFIRGNNGMSNSTLPAAIDSIQSSGDSSKMDSIPTDKSKVWTN